MWLGLKQAWSLPWGFLVSRDQPMTAGIFWCGVFRPGRSLNRGRVTQKPDLACAPPVKGAGLQTKAVLISAHMYIFVIIKSEI